MISVYSVDVLLKDHELELRLLRKTSPRLMWGVKVQKP
jgi:hypothetical protein